MNWVAWDKTISPVEYGGLGFGSLRDANLAMLAKWWWRFKSERKALWRNVIWAIHHSPRAWNDLPIKASIAGPWKGIISIQQSLLIADIDMRQAISAVLANGKSISFWMDSWVDPLPLYLKFPDLFKIELDKECTVHDRITVDNLGLAFNWAWARPVVGLVEQNQVQQIIALIGNYRPTSGKDRWCWKHDPNGIFSVASIKKILSAVNRINPARAFEWNNWVPKKVSIVAWRAEMEKMPTKNALAMWNIPVLDQMCVLCGEYVETCDHIFVSCHHAQTAWQNIAAWCNLPPIIAFGINDILSLHEVSSGSPKKKKAIHAIVLVTIWSIWKTRNDTVFRQKVPNAMKMLDEVKSMAYLWIKSRSKEMSLTWEAWSRFRFGD